MEFIVERCYSHRCDFFNSSAGKILTRLSLVLNFLLVISVNALAVDVPTIPENCFIGKSYCVEGKVIRYRIEENSTRLVRVNVFGELNVEDYDNVDEVVKIFLDFDKWQEYTERDGSRAIKIATSRKLSPVFESGKEIYRQYINSYVKAPMPVSSLQIRSVAHYWLIDSDPRMLVSAMFKHQEVGVFEIQGEDILYGGEGFKHFFGHLHIGLDSTGKRYEIYFTTYIRPNFPFLLDLARSYMEASILSVFRGMYGL